MRRVTINDIRKQGICVAGLRQFCEMNEIDFQKFIKTGIDLDEAENLFKGNAIVLKVLRKI